MDEGKCAMSLSIQLNRDDTRPIYLQIASQIRNQISVGRLPPGTRLPSVRAMAVNLHVNRLTVHNAYSELQADGWVESTVGRGTYVVEQAQAMTLLSTLSSEFSPINVLQDLAPIKQIPTVRSMGTAEPDPTLAPVDEFWGAMMALRREAATLMSYEIYQGDAKLRIELTHVLAERGISAMPDDIMVTSGAMHGLSLVTQAMTKPGDTVIIEEPTYLGLIHLLKMQGLRPIPVPLDTEGPRMDVLESVLKTESPTLMYTVPGFQNPTGLNMSPARRQEVLKMTRRYGVPLLEDDIYGVLAYDAPAPPAIRASDDSVIYISSMSKMLMPGLRIGYVVAPPDITRKLLAARLANDLYGVPFVQRALANFLHMGRLKAHLRRVIPIYGARRDAILSALRRHMPAGVKWTEPQGGFCLWLELPYNNMMAVYQSALKHGLAFTPGAAFMVDNRSNRYMRLCFSTQPVEEMDALIGLLADLIRAQGSRDQTITHDSPIWTPMT